MRGRGVRGFTLIELLVVVAIIAVLTAILLPSLARAKQQALRTTCLANMRGVAIATRTYAGTFDDQLPEVQGAAGSGNFVQALLTVYTAGSASPSDVGYGYGRLYATKFITDMRVAWCKENQDPGFSLVDSNVVLPWPSAYGAIKYRASDNFNANHNGNSVAYRKLSQYPTHVPGRPDYAGQGPFLIKDVMQNAGYTAHVDGKRAAYWNVVYADGHALSVRGEKVQSQLRAWITNEATGAGGGWDRAGRSMTS